MISLEKQRRKNSRLEPGSETRFWQLPASVIKVYRQGTVQLTRDMPRTCVSTSSSGYIRVACFIIRGVEPSYFFNVPLFDILQLNEIIETEFLRQEFIQNFS